MKKVLFITYFFPPLGGAGVGRSLKFSKYLPDFGWQPIVISAAESVSYGKDYSQLKEVPERINVYRIGHKEAKYKEWDYLLNKLKIRFDFPDIFKTWYSPALKKAREIISSEKIDLIFSSSAPYTSHFIAMKLKKEFKIPWVADFRDPWSGNDILTLSYESTLIKPLRKILTKKIRIAEKEILKATDKAIVVSWFHKKQLCDLHGIKNSLIEVITNGYDEADFREKKQYNLYPDKITVTYGGTFYFGYKKLAIDFLNALNTIETDIEVVFIGKGAAEMQNVDNHNLTCIYNLPKEKFLPLCSGSDFLLLLILPTAFWNIPGKIFDYLCSGRPILAIAPEDGDAARIIKEAKAGFILPYEKIKMEQQLKQIFEMHKEGTFTNFHPDWKYISQYERKKLTQRLALVFDEVVK